MEQKELLLLQKIEFGFYSGKQVEEQLTYFHKNYLQQNLKPIETGFSQKR